MLRYMRRKLLSDQLSNILNYFHVEIGNLFVTRATCKREVARLTLVKRNSLVNCQLLVLVIFSALQARNKSNEKLNEFSLARRFNSRIVDEQSVKFTLETLT